MTHVLNTADVLTQVTLSPPFYLFSPFLKILFVRERERERRGRGRGKSRVPSEQRA